MDKIPKQSQNNDRQSENIQENIRRGEYDGSAEPRDGRRRAGQNPQVRRQSGQMPARRAARYPGSPSGQRPKRNRRPSPLFWIIVLAVIVGLAAAIVLAFRDGDASRDGGGLKPGDPGYQQGIGAQKGKPSAAGYVNGKSKLILLDAGHGFGDIGCSPDALNGNVEKDITIKAVRMLKSKLEAKGYTVILTHDGETFTPASELIGRLKALKYEYKSDQIIDNNVFSAYERTMWANVLNSEGQIGAFISLHVNSNDSKSLTGFTIDYSGENDSTYLSEQLSSSIDSVLKRDYPGRSCKLFRDSWEDSYIVTKYSMMPSCLIEMGYGSSYADAALLLDDSWLDGLASSIADGVASYYNGNS